MKVTAWGKSMYGGWYANTLVETSDGLEHDGVRYEKLKELKAWAVENGVSLPNYQRYDN